MPERRLFLLAVLSGVALVAAQSEQYTRITPLPNGQTIKLENDCGACGCLSQITTAFSFMIPNGGTWVVGGYTNQDGSVNLGTCWKYTCTGNSPGLVQVEKFANANCTGSAVTVNASSQGACVDDGFGYGPLKATCMDSSSDEFVRYEVLEGDDTCATGANKQQKDVKVGSCFLDFKITGNASDGYYWIGYVDNAKCYDDAPFLMELGPLQQNCCNRFGELGACGMPADAGTLECNHFRAEEGDPVTSYQLQCDAGQVCGAISAKSSVDDKMFHIGGCNFRMFDPSTASIITEAGMAATCDAYKTTYEAALTTLGREIEEWECYTCDSNNCNDMTAKDKAFLKKIILGGAVGGTLLVLLCIGCCWWCCCRDKSKNNAAQVKPAHAVQESVDLDEGVYV